LKFIVNTAMKVLISVSFCW